MANSDYHIEAKNLAQRANTIKESLEQLAQDIRAFNLKLFLDPENPQKECRDTIVNLMNEKEFTPVDFNILHAEFDNEDGSSNTESLFFYLFHDKDKRTMAFLYQVLDECYDNTCYTKASIDMALKDYNILKHDKSYFCLNFGFDKKFADCHFVQCLGNNINNLLVRQTYHIAPPCLVYERARGW
ncbi:hypothetical protein ACHJH3_06840 [Campylobacter sp. MOP7]|uniref:hypothetical protein n=1 Tax=Campylobacter canis TaxID=3378588 RepID=UPI00387E6744